MSTWRPPARRVRARARAAGTLGPRLEAAPDLPDSVFVEDAAVVLDEVAIVTRPGAASRRPETAAVADALGGLRSLEHIVEPGTLDGGDVLRVGRRLFVGRSRRTNDEGIGQLRAIAERFGWTVHPVPHRALPPSEIRGDGGGGRYAPHRSTCGARGRLRWLSPDRGRPARGHCRQRPARARHRDLPGCLPRDRGAPARRGDRLQLLDVSEIAKAEGGVTCCSHPD